MTPRVLRVCTQTNVAALLLLQIMSAWPDVTLAARYISGFPVIGRIEGPPVFRPLLRHSDPVLPSVLLERSAEFVTTLQSRAGTKRDAVADKAVWEATMKDVKRGFMAKPLDRDAFDDLYGPGRWLPLPRFPIKQGDKWRPIDDAKASGTNSAAQHERRVHTASVDFAVQLSMWLRGVWRDSFSATHPDCTVEGGVDDESSAFRFVPTCEDDAPFLVVAVYNPGLQRVQFATMWGHPFGVGSAVTNYNRRPELVVHVMRTWLAVLIMHFYDDALMLSLSLEKGSAQQAYHALLDITGTSLDASKRQRMDSTFIYVGVSFQLAGLLRKGTLVVDAKPGRREALLAEVRDFRSRGTMSPTDASSFR